MAAAWRTPALVAAVLAFASAAVSLYWTLGGMLLLDTVGGALEELARRRSAGALALGVATVLLKVGAGVLAVLLARSRGGPGRLLLGLNGAVAAVLVLWGGANVVVGGLLLVGLVTTSEPADEYALRWHVFFWDLWFVVWGAALLLAVWRRGRLR